MDPTTNPWVFANEGDSSHNFFPGQKIWINWLVIHGGPAAGNVMLLDTDGTLRQQAGSRHGIEPSNQMDPRVVTEGPVTADSRTEVLVDRYVRGLFLDDIPDGGKVLVWHGK